MQEDLGDEGMAEGVDTIARHTFTKERQPQAMLQLSYHQPNRLSQQNNYPQPIKAKAEELLGEEQTGFRPGRSAVEQISNS